MSLLLVGALKHYSQIVSKATESDRTASVESLGEYDTLFLETLMLGMWCSNTDVLS